MQEEAVPSVLVPSNVTSLTDDEIALGEEAFEERLYLDPVLEVLNIDRLIHPDSETSKRALKWAHEQLNDAVDWVQQEGINDPCLRQAKYAKCALRKAILAAAD